MHLRQEEHYLLKSLLTQLNPIILDCSKIVFPGLDFGEILMYRNNLKFAVPVQSSHSTQKPFMLALSGNKRCSLHHYF